jgi:hypothetical protein
MFAASVVVYIGGLVLHVWTAYLFFENWGTFWSIVSLFVPPFGELFALGACFGWGVWFYVLAVAAIMVGTTSFPLADEAASRSSSRSARLLFVASAIPLYVLLGKGISRAEYATKIKTAEQREWQLMGEVYEDLLGSAMPGREELIGRPSSSGH